MHTPILTLSNPIFLPTAYSPALTCFGRDRGWWITSNYPTLLKEKKKKTQRNRKSTTCTICWLKPVLHDEKRRTGSESGRTNATKTVSDVFRHRSGTGKSYCRTRSDVGLERVNIPLHILYFIRYLKGPVNIVLPCFPTESTQNNRIAQFMLNLNVYSWKWIESIDTYSKTIHIIHRKVPSGSTKMGTDAKKMYIQRK